MLKQQDVFVPFLRQLGREQMSMLLNSLHVCTPECANLKDCPLKDRNTFYAYQSIGVVLQTV